MPLTIASDPLPLQIDDHGTYRVGESGVRLDTVVFVYNKGASAEQIVREFPTLEPGDVHAVIAYYLHHRAEVDAYLEERERAAAEIRATLEREGYGLPDSTRAAIRRRFEERNHRGA